MSNENQPATTVKVTVVFPLGAKPFHEEVTPRTTVGIIRSRAMTYFGIAEDGQSTYYLTFRNQRQRDDIKVGDLAGPAHAVQFTMVKELIQGA
jgi:hypothetical protein